MSDVLMVILMILGVIALNVLGVCLVGWLGVLFVNAVFATNYPVYVGIAVAALILLVKSLL